MNVRFKVIDLEGNYTLQFEDATGEWHNVPVVGLTEAERDAIRENNRIEEQHAVPPEAAQAATGDTEAA